MSKKGIVKFGFIGLGRRGLRHLKVASKFEAASIKALCDLDESRIREEARIHGAGAYTSLDEMLEREQLDVVVIATPTPLHASQTLRCLEEGVHVLLEKPIALEMSEVKRLLEAVKRSDRMVVVGFQSRYSEIVEKFKENVDADTLSMVAGYWYWTIPLVRWVALRSQGGGQIVDQAIHLIDIARFIVGDDVEKVYAIYTERGRDTEEDKSLGFENWASYSVSFKFENGVIGNIYSTYALYPEIFRDEKTVGEPPVCIDAICRDLLVRYIHMKETKVYRRGEETEVYRLKEDPTVNMYSALIEAVLTGDRSLIRTPYEDSYRTMAIALAANTSAITGEVVDMEGFIEEG